MKKALYSCRIKETHTKKDGYRTTKKLQFLQDNEEGMRQIAKCNLKLVLCIMKEPLQEKHTETDTERDRSKGITDKTCSDNMEKSSI